jgi:hypothetical protein
MRRSVFALVLVLAGCGSPPPAQPPTAAPVVRVTVAGGCGSTPVHLGDMPGWTASAGVPGGLQWVASAEENLVGVLFGAPLHVRPAPDGRNNKILWISREPRDGKPLELTATLVGGQRPAVTASEPANSSPGEIYPSIVDVPVPGCWHVAAAWNGHTATLDLNYPS